MIIIRFRFRPSPYHIVLRASSIRWRLVVTIKDRILHQQTSGVDFVDVPTIIVVEFFIDICWKDGKRDVRQPSDSLQQRLRGFSWHSMFLDNYHTTGSSPRYQELVIAWAKMLLRYTYLCVLSKAIPAQTSDGRQKSMCFSTTFPCEMSRILDGESLFICKIHHIF